MDIHEEVNHILGGIEFEAAHASPIRLDAERVKRHLRKMLAETLGLKWTFCTVEEHTLPATGQRLYVAALDCKRCHTIHTYVAYVDAGGFKFAAPLEEEG